MRFALHLFMVGAVVCYLQTNPANARPRLPKTVTKCLAPGSAKPITCLSVEGGETFDLMTLDESGNLVVTPYSDDDEDALVAVPIAADTAAGVKPSDDGYYWFFDATDLAFLASHLGSSVDLPGLTKPDGTPLLSRYRETDFDFILEQAREFAVGDVLSVRDGTAIGWPGPIIYEVPATFALDELFALDPGRFPVYAGDAVVAEIGQISAGLAIQQHSLGGSGMADVSRTGAIPEPVSIALFSVGLAALSLLGRARQLP